MTDDIILRTGRSFYANCNIVGIDGSGEVHEGYDGGVYTDQWTPEDRTALAEMMIARWIEFSPGALPAMIAEAVARERAVWISAIEQHFDATAVMDIERAAEAIRNRKDTTPAPQSRRNCAGWWGSKDGDDDGH